MKRNIYFLVPAMLAMALAACGAKSPAEVTSNDKVVVAYVTSGSTDTPDTELITHINYAFGRVNAEFDGVVIRNEGRLRQLVALKAQKPTLKVLVSIGGWGAGGFSEMASDDVKRASFAADCKRIVDEFSLDGIDLDWEYPSSDAAGITASPDDIDNFTKLVCEIRAAIGKDKLITLASSASHIFYDFAAIDPYMDFYNIMLYDVGRPPRHQAALYHSSMAGSTWVVKSVDDHVAAGAPVEKLVLGIPFYGHGSKSLPRDIPYRDIVALTGYTAQWDDQAKVPYLTDADGEFVCTYDDARSIALKCEYLLARGMLGAMYWQYAQDDDQGSLRKAVWEGVMNPVK